MSDENGVVDGATVIDGAVSLAEYGDIESHIDVVVRGRVCLICGDKTDFGKMGMFVNRTPFCSRGVSGHMDDASSFGGRGTIRIGW